MRTRVLYERVSFYYYTRIDRYVYILKAYSLIVKIISRCGGTFSALIVIRVLSKTRKGFQFFSSKMRAVRTLTNIPDK